MFPLSTFHNMLDRDLKSISSSIWSRDGVRREREDQTASSAFMLLLPLRFYACTRPSICSLTVFSSAQPQPTYAAQPGPGTQVTYHALVAAPSASAFEKMVD